MANKTSTIKTKNKKQIKKEKLLKRIGAVVLSAVAVVILLAIGSNMASSALLSGPKPGFYINGEKRVKDASPMLTVGDIEFDVLEYRYYYFSRMAAYNTENGTDASYWLTDEDGTREKELRDLVEDDLVYYATWLQWAQDKGIALSETATQQIYTEIKNAKAQDRDAFLLELSNLYISDEETFIKIRIKHTTITKAQEAYDAEIESEHGANWKDQLVSVKQIYIKYETDDDSAAKAEKVKQAEELVEMLEKASVNKRYALFTSLQAEHSNDSRDEDGKLAYTQYTLYPSQQGIMEIYDAAMEMDAGEFSDVIKTEYGCFIIMRIDLDTDYIASSAEDLKSAVYSYMETEMITKKQESMAVIGGKYYSQVSITTLK